MSTPRLALIFHPLDVVFPNLVGAIHGLNTRLIQPVYEMVINHFLSPEAEALFKELTFRPPNPIVPPDDAQAYFTNTMYVRRLDCRARGNTHAPVFIIYMNSPATDYHSYRKWSAFCKTINLSHSLYGSGTLRAPGVCAGCHAQDHPTGLCRLPKVDGWLSPPPFTTPDFSIPSVSSSRAPSMGDQAMSGNRGRGRRRNNMGRGSRTVTSPRDRN